MTTTNYFYKNGSNYTDLGSTFLTASSGFSTSQIPVLDVSAKIIGGAVYSPFIYGYSGLNLKVTSFRVPFVLNGVVQESIYTDPNNAYTRTWNRTNGFNMYFTIYTTQVKKDNSNIIWSIDCSPEATITNYFTNTFGTMIYLTDVVFPTDPNGLTFHVGIRRTDSYPSWDNYTCYGHFLIFHY